MEVLVAHDGQSGIDLACSASPDILLLDFRMPGLDGLYLAKPFVNDEVVAVVRRALQTRAHVRELHNIVRQAVLNSRDLMIGEDVMRDLLKAPGAPPGRGCRRRCGIDGSLPARCGRRGHRRGEARSHHPCPARGP
jgi:DNA-binding NtrC family response regulator